MMTSLTNPWNFDCAGRVHFSRGGLIWHWCFVHDSYTKGEIRQWGGVQKGEGSKVMRVRESKKKSIGWDAEKP